MPGANHLTHVHAQISCRARSLILCLNIYPSQYLDSASSQGSGKTVPIEGTSEPVTLADAISRIHRMRLLINLVSSKCLMPSCDGEMTHAKCHANKTQMPRSGSNQHAHLLVHVLFRQSTEEGKLTFSFIIYWNITKQNFCTIKEFEVSASKQYK